MIELIWAVLLAAIIFGWNWGTAIYPRFQGADKAARKVRERLYRGRPAGEDSVVIALEVQPLSKSMIKKIAREEGSTYSGDGTRGGTAYMFTPGRGTRSNGNSNV